MTAPVPDSISIDPTLLTRWPVPQSSGSKHESGDIVIVGGSRKTPGAVLLAGLAAMRVGAGRVTLAVADSVAAPLAVAFPESGVIGLHEDASGSIDGRGLAALESELAGADVALIGPGLDDPRGTARLLRSVVLMLTDVPAVHLDAFPLGVLPGLPRVRRALAGRMLLTPNAEEAARLLGEELDDVGEAALAIARRYDAVVSCFNHVATPGGELFSAAGAHPGLGTAGSGDVLAGATAGIRARGVDAAGAACWGVHLHTSADDRLGGSGYLAREVPGTFADTLARAR